MLKKKNMTASILLLLLQVWTISFGIVRCEWFDTRVSDASYSWEPYSQPAMWFMQKLDHFDRESNKTWDQKYYIDAEYYFHGNPVILYIGGEGPANSPAKSRGFWTDLAQDIGAMMFVLEHRYYGESSPTTYHSTEYLEKYLTVEQAIEDIANFVRSMNDKHQLQKSKWITIGGSYPGSLSLYARLKNPNLIHGCISASPAFPIKPEYPGYTEVIAEAIYTYGGEECLNQLVEAYNDLYNNMQTFAGRTKIQSTFNLCELYAHDTSEVMAVFYTRLHEIVQYNNETSYTKNIQSVCRHMTGNGYDSLYTNKQKSKESPMSKLTYLSVPDYYNVCEDLSYRTSVNKYRSDFSSSIYSDSRSWEFQICSQLGNLQTTSSLNQPFRHVPFEFRTTRCGDIFGKKYGNKNMLQDNIKKLLKSFLGRNIALNITNAVIINGGVDPWRKASFVPELYGPNANVSKYISQLQIKGTDVNLLDFVMSPDIPVLMGKIFKEVASKSAKNNTGYPDDLDPSLYGYKAKNSQDSNGLRTFFAPRAAHCAILKSYRYGEPPMLEEIRRAVTNLVKQWLKT